MWEILDDLKSDDRALLARILLWIDEQAAARRLSGDHAQECALMLLWWFALPRAGAWHGVARILATLLRAHPELAGVLLREARTSGDVDVEAGVWATIHGALMRTGGRGSAATALLDAASAGLAGLPLHYHLVLSAYHVAGWAPGPPAEPRTGFREFVRRHAAPPPPALPLPSFLLSRHWWCRTRCTTPIGTCTPRGAAPRIRTGGSPSFCVGWVAPE
jgi:hypothetical protein